MPHCARGNRLAAGFTMASACLTNPAGRIHPEPECASAFAQADKKLACRKLATRIRRYIRGKAVLLAVVTPAPSTVWII